MPRADKSCKQVPYSLQLIMNNMTCLQINTRHSRTASAALAQLIIENNYDVVCVQEPYASLTYSDQTQPPYVRISNIPPGYQCFHNLNDDHAYGALIFARSSLKARNRTELSSNNISAIQFKVNSSSITIFSVYLRPTDKNPENSLYITCAVFLKMTVKLQSSASTPMRRTDYGVALFPMQKVYPWKRPSLRTICISSTENFRNVPSLRLALPSLISP
jgi:hypothetical protein